MKTWKEFVEYKQLLIENAQAIAQQVVNMLWGKFGTMFGTPEQFAKFVSDTILRDPSANQILQNRDAQTAARLIMTKLQPEQDYNPSADTGLGDQSQYGR